MKERRNETVKRLFIDMDGTLCRFYEQAWCVEKCREPEFFLGLNPYENLLKAIRIIRDRILVSKENCRFYALSAIYDARAGEEKKRWIQDYLGDDFPAIFVPVNGNKATFIGAQFGKTGLTENDFLLDDYSRNLVEWSDAGGTAVKFRNELNGRGWNGYNFSGHTVYYDQKPEELAHDILSIMGLIDEEKTSPDEPISEEVMREEIDRIMSLEPTWKKDGEEWTTELYADYRDELCYGELFLIFCSDDPRSKFYEWIENSYFDAECAACGHISSEVRRKLGERGGLFAVDKDGFFIDEETEELYRDLFDYGIFRCNLPYDHYLKQKVRLNIMIDTGDGNRDYIENAVYPHWDGTKGAEISDKASIVWLARTQGVSKAELEAALNDYRDGLEKSGFLETLGQELINMPSQMAVLTFLIETTLEKALEIADCMKPNYIKANDPTIKIGKNTLTGLYDPWGGGGSLFDIKLERDVEIPLRYVRSVKPDGCDGSCTIEEVYGMCPSAWRDTLLAITVQTNAA